MRGTFEFVEYFLRHKFISWKFLLHKHNSGQGLLSKGFQWVQKRNIGYKRVKPFLTHEQLHKNI